jgi:hypothetical protein
MDADSFRQTGNKEAVLLRSILPRSRLYCCQRAEARFMESARIRLPSSYKDRIDHRPHRHQSGPFGIWASTLPFL